MYWSTEYYIWTQCFGKIMSQNRFHLILKCLHFNNVHNTPLNPIKRNQFLMEPQVTSFKNKFASVYNPRQNLALDESLMKWLGRLSWKVCISKT